MKLLTEQGKVRILSRGVEHDKTLPKYSKLYENGTDKEVISTEIPNVTDLSQYLKAEVAEDFNLAIEDYLFKRIGSTVNITTEGGFITTANSETLVLADNSVPPQPKSQPGILEKIIRKFKKSGQKVEVPIPEEVIYKFNLIDLFGEIKVLAGQEQEFTSRLESYVALIKKAQALGQIAQTETLVDRLILHIYESILSVSGYNRYITSEQLVKLQMNCEEQLDLDYIRNFVRVIPDDIVTKKLGADKLMVFDNYAVLHYNPDGKSYEATEEEKKDPILFGLITGSDRLYYIGDWVDELCDLTWDGILDLLEEVNDNQL